MKTSEIKLTITGIIPNGKFGVSFETDATFKRGYNPKETTNIVNVSNVRGMQVLSAINKPLKRLLLLNSPNDSEMQAIIKYCLLGSEATFEILELEEKDVCPIKITHMEGTKEITDIEENGIIPKGVKAYLFKLKSAKVDFDDDDMKEMKSIIQERKALEMAD